MPTPGSMLSGAANIYVGENVLDKVHITQPRSEDVNLPNEEIPSYLPIDILYQVVYLI